MENLSVVCFFMNLEGNGKRRRKDPWEYHIEKSFLRGKDELPLWKVYLPAYSYKKKPWKRQDWNNYMQGMQEVPAESGGVCYLLDKEVQHFLGREQEPLSYEWLIYLIEHMQVAFDALVIFQDRELEAQRIVERYASTAKYLGVVTSNEGEWKDMEEYLAEEYGFMLEIADNLKGLHIPEKSKLLTIAGEKLYGTTPLSIPKESVWISTQVENEESKRLCARGKEIRFISIKSIFQ